MNEIASILRDTMNFHSLWILSAALFVVVFLIQWKMVRRISYLERTWKERLAQVSRLDSDFAALCSASKGTGSRMLEVGKQIHRLAARQEQLEMRGGSERIYQQAITRVHRGADADELVKQCGLSRTEAELLVTLHRLPEAG